MSSKAVPPRSVLDPSMPILNLFLPLHGSPCSLFPLLLIINMSLLLFSFILFFRQICIVINFNFPCVSFFILCYIVFVHYVECPSGAFKSTISNTKCVQCPLKSVSNAERTACTCEEGFYRFPDVGDCKGTMGIH